MKTLLPFLVLLVACGDASTGPAAPTTSVTTDAVCARWGWIHVANLPYLVPACIAWEEPRP